MRGISAETRKEPSYQSANHKNFIKMEAWILGLSCLQCLNQISNMLSSLWGQNKQSQRQYVDWELSKGSQPWLHIIRIPTSGNEPQRVRFNWTWVGPGIMAPQTKLPGTSLAQELMLPAPLIMNS